MVHRYDDTANYEGIIANYTVLCNANEAMLHNDPHNKSEQFFDPKFQVQEPVYNLQKKMTTLL